MIPRSLKLLKPISWLHKALMWPSRLALLATRFQELNSYYLPSTGIKDIWISLPEDQTHHFVLIRPTLYQWRNPVTLFCDLFSMLIKHCSLKTCNTEPPIAKNKNKPKPKNKPTKQTKNRRVSGMKENN